MEEDTGPYGRDEDIVSIPRGFKLSSKGLLICKKCKTGASRT
jgi:hypothetical protein